MPSHPADGGRLLWTPTKLGYLFYIPALLPPGHPVEESDNLRLRQDGGLHSLHIAHVSSEDEGLYVVSATNTHGQAHCSAQLYVEEPRTAASGPRYHLGLPVLLGTATEGAPPALRGSCPVPGGAALHLWTAVWSLQLKAGEDAIHPRGARAGRAGAAVHS